MGKSDSIERLDHLIAKGRAILLTHKPNPPGMGGFPTLDSGLFTAWKSQAVACLLSILGEGNVYVDDFKGKVKSGYRDTVRAGIELLTAVKEDLASGHFERKPNRDPLILLEQLCSRFHLVVRQLRSRHGDRQTLDVKDEYDVQDLMHALLVLHFVDVRPEEYTPSYAGKASRIDFVLKQEAIAFELKMTRTGLGPKELSTQLIEDIERYKTHPDCKTLVCFAYDPSGLIPNPVGIESDLKREGAPFPVRVFIYPK